jgi:hypothetical protein
MRVYQRLAGVAGTLNNPKASSNYLGTQCERLDAIIKLAPSGGAFHRGTEFISVRSNDRRLVFLTSYQTNTPDGLKETEYTVTAVASFMYGFTLQVSGKNAGDGVKEHIHDVFTHFLNTEVQ